MSLRKTIPRSNGSSLRPANVMFLLLPSWLSASLNAKTASRPNGSSTAYLHGLRGLFSFLVFIRHFLTPWEKDLDTGYNLEPNSNIFKLPFIRLFYSSPNVPVFLVSSGFVLSYKPLGYIHQGNFDSLIRTLITSVFRRPLRLFLPPLITTFFVALAVHFGFYNSPYGTMPGRIPLHPDRFDSLILQLLDWVRFVLVDLTHPWSWEPLKCEYDTHLWTIPIQFRASMIAFLALIGLARVKPPIRLAILFGLCCYSLQQSRWEMILYMSGIILAEGSLARDRIRRPDIIPTTRHINSESYRLLITRKIFWKLLFLTGLYLGSYPRARGAGLETIGFVWMSKLTPDYHYWHTFGAIFIVWAVGNDISLQSLFTSSPMRYMGNISFSLYLIHGPTLHTFGYSLVPVFIGLTGRDTMLQYQLGVGFALIFLTPVVLWIADLFWRLVEKPCVSLTAQIEAYCFRDSV